GGEFVGVRARRAIPGGGSVRGRPRSRGKFTGRVVGGLRPGGEFARREIRGAQRLGGKIIGCRVPRGPGVIQRGRVLGPTVAVSGATGTVVTAGSGPPATGGHRPPGTGRLFQRAGVGALGPPLRVVVVTLPGGLAALRAAAVAVAIAPVLGLRPGP